MWGKVLFYLTWPLVWFYAPITLRARVALLVDGEVLAVKGWFGPHDWQLPGGGVNLGESVVRAAKREIYEELAVDIDESLLIRVTPDPVHHTRKGLLLREVFFVYHLQHKPDFRKDKELVAAEWMPIASCGMPRSVAALLQSTE